jgi:hypothetical protein
VRAPGARVVDEGACAVQWPGPTPPREVPRRDPFEADPHLFEPEPYGVGLRDLTPGERDRFGVEAGALVAYVRPGGLAGIGLLRSRRSRHG